MSIEAGIRRAGPYATNGVTTDFVFEFKVFAEEDLLVTLVEDGSASNPELNTAYTVTLNADQDNDPGGTIEFIEAPNGPAVTITSAMEIEQPAVFTNSGGFYPRVLNDALDRLTIIQQQQDEVLDRAIVVPYGETGLVLPYASVRANGQLGFDADGNLEVFASQAGTLENNSGFTAGGPVVIQGDSATQFRLIGLDDSVQMNVRMTTSFVSANGTRTSQAPRITFGSGTDIGFDSLMTTNIEVEGASLYRDVWQDTETFHSTGGDGARATLDMFVTVLGTTAINHIRGTQFRPKFAMGGTPLVSEVTGHYIQPIYAGTQNIDQMAGVWIRAVQNDSGVTNVFNGYGILIDTMTGWGNVDAPFAIYVNTDKSYFGGHLQMGATRDIFGGRELLMKALHATGAIAAFNPTGGLALWAPGAGNPARMRAYTDAGGAALALAVNDNGGPVWIGSVATIAGKTLEVTGAILTTVASFVDGNQVVSDRGAAVADAAGGATVDAEARTALNALLARLRPTGHGLIAA